MGRPVALQQTWSAMRQDEERGRMVKGAVWNMVDVIPDLDDAPGGKRGGWAYASGNIHAANSGASYIAAGAYAPFSAGAKNVAIDQAGELYTVADDGTVTDKGAAVAPLQTPVIHADLLIIPASDGTTGPSKFDGAAAPTSLGGTPPAGKYAEVYKDRTCLANTSAQLTYVYFSGASDPETWDTTAGWQSVQAPVTGLASLPNALMVFQEAQTSRIRGYTPPPNGDFIVDDPLFKIGCTDARSIAVDGGYCIFANPQGIYLSDGTLKPEDLTESIGLKRYWAGLFNGYSMSDWTIAAGIIKNHYLVTVMDGATFVDCLMIDIPGRRGWRLANMPTTGFWPAVSVSAEMYMGLRSGTRVAKTSTIFTPSAAVKTDADGTAVTPEVETPFYRDRGGFKRWKGFYLGYDMRDAALNDPALTVSYITNPEDSYTDFATTLAETTNYKRTLIREPLRAEGVGFRIQQTGASSSTRLYDLEAEVYAEETSRVA